MRREWPVRWSGTLARVSVEVPGPLRRYGRPIRYGYTERDQPLSAYQTVFAVDSPDASGSAEMPSAARPFTTGPVAALVSRGVHLLTLDPEHDTPNC